MQKPAKSFNDNGFTMIEAVIVLVLLGIVSAVVIPRFLNASAFDSLAARDGIITVARSAQQLALGREVVTFTLSTDGDEWVASANANGSVLRTASFPTRALTLSTGGTAPSGNTCSSAFNDAVAADFTVGFDSLGNAVSLKNNSSTETVSNGVRICLNHDVSFSVCLSPAGYASVGDCDD